MGTISRGLLRWKVEMHTTFENRLLIGEMRKHGTGPTSRFQLRQTSMNKKVRPKIRGTLYIFTRHI